MFNAVEEDVFVFIYLRLNAGALWVIGGDHNSVIRKADIEGGIGFATKNCEALKNLIKCEKFVDCFLQLHEGRQEFTFHRPISRHYFNSIKSVFRFSK